MKFRLKLTPFLWIVKKYFAMLWKFCNFAASFETNDRTY